MTKYVDLEIRCSFCVYVSIFVTFTLTTNPKMQITYKSWRILTTQTTKYSIFRTNC